MRASTLLRIVATLALVVNVASAHHPFSVNYDENKFGTLTGTVAVVQWTNPHVVLALDVDTDGKTERWMIEGSAPNALLRQGWTKDSLSKGSLITISGWHARNDNLKIFSARDVTFEDGSTRVFGGGPGQLWKCAGSDCPATTWIPSITQ